MGVELPKTLFEISSHKVFGLTINPVVLQAIRRTRAKTLGLAESDECHYSEMDYVKQDLEYARKIFAQNPSWPVIGKELMWYIYVHFNLVRSDICYTTLMLQGATKLCRGSVKLLEGLKLAEEF